MKLISAKDWSEIYLSEDLVSKIQSNALGYAVSVIQDAVDTGLPVDSGIALVRIKAGNLTDGQQTTKLMKKIIITLLAVSTLAISALAPPDPDKPRSVPVKEPVVSELFGEKEVVLDLAATYTVAELGGIKRVLETDARHGDYGMSLGLTKFVTKHFGIGLEAGVTDGSNADWLDYGNIVAVARLPIGKVAPYAIAGGGHDFHIGTQHALAGAGCEYRMTPRAGLFAEARFVFGEGKSTDTLVSRLGVRFAF